ncbi:hypothetical protein MPLSOD_280057 [Mesorhizobium sp. SOD10]|nr:hypothetical protein MPLSOD_280057 [Mesorhizobium sp. SOD10]
MAVTCNERDFLFVQSVGQRVRRLAVQLNDKQRDIDLLPLKENKSSLYGSGGSHNRVACTSDGKRAARS